MVVEFKKLLEDKISYEQEVSFDNLKNINNLYLDFYFHKINLIVEIDGELHFKKCSFFNNSNTLIANVKRDSIKNEWANNHIINFLEEIRSH